MGETGGARSRGALPLALRVLLIIGFAIAVGATALVVFADDVRMLRLAAVLALWAALIAAFAVSRSRRDARAAAMRENEAQLAYQLELHREVAARREYEADLAGQVAAAQSDQLAELRGQLQQLTSVLSSLVDGEVTVSRLTLSAESTRFRRVAGQRDVLPEGAAVTAGEAADRTAGLGTDDVVDAEVDAEVDGDADADTVTDEDVPAGDPGPGPDDTPAAVDEAPEAGDHRPDSPAGSWAIAHAARAQVRTHEISAVPERRSADELAGSASAPKQSADAAQPAEAARPAEADGAAAQRDEPAEADEVLPAGEADEDDDEPGDHASGVSVSDLLAAYGMTDRLRRRRRR